MKDTLASGSDSDYPRWWTRLIAVALAVLFAFGVNHVVQSIVGDTPVTAAPASQSLTQTGPGPWASGYVLAAPVRLPAPSSAQGYADLWGSLDDRLWGAADVSLSVRLTQGPPSSYDRVLWLYGDTLSRHGLVHSSAIVQDGGRLHVSHAGQQLLPNTGSVVYWIEAGKSVGNGNVEVTAAPMSLGTGGVWDFQRARAKSRVAVVHVNMAGDLTFMYWKGYVKAPKPFTDFKVIGDHHFTYEARSHPEAVLASGKTLWTVNQNWDDGTLHPFADYRPIFSER